MKKLKVIGLMVVISALSIFSGVTKSFAVPDLQLYMVGSTYDYAAETWVVSHADPLYLQVIGANKDIFDVKVAIAVPEGQSGEVKIKFDGNESIYTTYDTANISDTDNIYPFIFGIPIDGNGNTLPQHGVYPTSYATFFVGNFTPQYEVSNMSPGETGTAQGQIEELEINISEFSWAHFDAFDHYVKTNGKWQYIKAPFSHDAEYMPEPSSLILLGMGLLGLAGAKRKKRKVID